MRGSRARAVRGALTACVLAALLVASAAGKSTPDPPRGDADPPRVGDIQTSDKQRFSIRAFFRRLDVDGDGQIETDELSAYVGSSVGGNDFDEASEIAAAAASTTALIDGGDQGSTISEEELMTHITRATNHLLTPNRVARWVRFGLSLPQYSDAFSDNAVTALDFPVLVADHGAVLRDELGVKSGLHHGKILRALKRQILGLGAPPGAPTNVRAVAVNATAVAVQWRAPAALGTPPVHAYVLQRRAGDDPKWQVDAVLDAEELAHVSRVAETAEANASLENESLAGSRLKNKNVRRVWNPDGQPTQPTRLRQYRVVAWGAHGSSGYSDPSEVVDVDAAGADSRRSLGDFPNARRRRGLFLKGVDAIEEDPSLTLNLSASSVPATLWRAAASSLLIAGVIARFVFGAASFLGVPGALSGVALRKAADALGRGGTRGFFRLLKKDGAGPAARAGPGGSPAVPGTPAAGGARGDGARRVPSGEITPERASGSTPGALPGSGVSPPAYAAEEARSRSRRSAMFEDAMAAAVAAGVAGSAASGPTPPASGARADAADADASSEESAERGAPLGAAFAAHSRNVSGDGSDEPPRLADATAPFSSAAKKKGRCCVAGCAKRWDKWMSTSGFRMKPAKHYCGLCQRAYCVAHTATSPHGAKGRCDPESKCVCVVCYQSLDEHARFALEATNKLPRVTHFARGELAASPSSRARSRWQSVKQYQLRTSDSTNLPLSPATSSGNLRAAAS